MSLICNYILVVVRIFVNTNRGEGYEEIIPIIHIGFLDFTLFKDTPEFYSEFKIMNVKTHYVYSGKFVLHLVKHLKITEEKLAKHKKNSLKRTMLSQKRTNSSSNYKPNFLNSNNLINPIYEALGTPPSTSCYLKLLPFSPLSLSFTFLIFYIAFPALFHYNIKRNKKKHSFSIQKCCFKLLWRFYEENINR